MENTKVKNQNLNYVRPAYLVKTSKKALFEFRCAVKSAKRWSNAPMFLQGPGGFVEIVLGPFESC